MATLNQVAGLKKNPHLRERTAAALSVAAEAVRNEQQDFTAVAATDIFTATAHGYADGAKVELAGTSLPAGVTAATTYFIRDQTANTFKLAETSGGTAIDLTVDGFGQIAVEHHPARFTWASGVLLTSNAAPVNEALRAMWLILQNATIADGYAGDFTSGGAVTDGDVQFVANSLVNILAGAES